MLLISFCAGQAGEIVCDVVGCHDLRLSCHVASIMNGYYTACLNVYSGSFRMK